MAEWSIEILEGANGTVDFRPDVHDAKLGQALGVRRGDNVTWNNRTNRPLVLESIDPPETFLTEEIPADSASNPTFNVTQAAETTITYSCKARCIACGSSVSVGQHSIVVRRG